MPWVGFTTLIVASHSSQGRFLQIERTAMDVQERSIVAL